MDRDYYEALNNSYVVLKDDEVYCEPRSLRACKALITGEKNARIRHNRYIDEHPENVKLRNPKYIEASCWEIRELIIGSKLELGEKYE